MGARLVNDSVAGSQSSGVSTASAIELPYVVPPDTSTLRSGNSVRFRCRRRYFMAPTRRHTGLGLFKSITSAVAIAVGFTPPALNIFPGRYMTEDPYCLRA